VKGVPDRKDSTRDMRILRRSVHSVGGPPAWPNVLEGRRNVLAQFQGMGTHVRRDLAGFLCVSLAPHRSAVPRQVSASTWVNCREQAISLRTRLLVEWRYFANHPFKIRPTSLHLLTLRTANPKISGQ
jgi:hypothetical protein